MLKLILALSTSIFATTVFAKPITYKVDAASSKVTWLGKKVTGQHDGVIQVKNGEIQVDGKKIVAGKIVIDMKSISNLDIKDAGKNKDLVDHLSSEDFFSVAKHGTAELKIIAVKETAPNKAEVSAELTIKGITKAQQFPVDMTWSDGQVKAQGKLLVDRTQFDIKYRSGKFFPNIGDKMINDQFEIGFDLIAKK